MPLDTPHRLSQAAFWYTAFPAVTLSFVAVIAGAFMKDTVHAACMQSTCPPYIPYIVPTIVIVFIAAALAHPILSFILFSYSLSERSITINSGIIFRQYETIDFSRIQTLDLERGPLLWLFGLTEVNLWTASADQFNNDAGQPTHAHPDTTFVLDRDTAESLRSHIAAVKQPVPPVSVQPTPPSSPIASNI